MQIERSNFMWFIKCTYKTNETVIIPILFKNKYEAYKYKEKELMPSANVDVSILNASTNLISNDIQQGATISC